MQSKNPVITDFIKLANSAAGTFAGMSREMREAGRERLKEALGGMDFVSREEFDAVKDLAAKAREQADRLQERIAALEARLAGPGTAVGEGQGAGAAEAKASGLNPEEA